MNTFKLDGIWDFYFDAEGKTIADTLPVFKMVNLSRTNCKITDS